MLEETLDNVSSDSSAQTTAVVIANPTSGSYAQHAQQVEETITFLRSHHWDVTLLLTEAEGDARRLAREAVERHVDIVIAAGGDGTIHEVIQELAGSETTLGVLPIGTVNVWARETGIPLNGPGAREVLLYGRVRRVDLGQVQGRYFLLMAGIGLDGEVTQAVEKKPLKRLGALGYLLMGTVLGLGYQDFRVFMQLDGRRIVKANALQVIIGNTQLYGGAIKYTWQASCDDGLLDICIVRRRSMLGRIVVFFDFLLHHERRHRWIRYERCKTVKIRTKRAIAMQLDGEPVGYISAGFPPTTFTVVPGILKVLVPPQANEPLFVQP
jgi:diacylglycerol kinase (ATP)